MSRLFVSPGFYGVIVFTLGFKTRCNSSAIVEGIKNTWIKLPRFSSKVVMDDKKNGEAVWLPVSVRVEDHVFVPDIDPSDITNPDQFIEDYTSNIANTGHVKTFMGISCTEYKDIKRRIFRYREVPSLTGRWDVSYVSSVC